MNLMSESEARSFKERTRQQWDRSANGWNAHTGAVREWLRAPTEAMLEMAGIQPGSYVLDVAAGAGDQTLDIARRVGSAGRVLATDLSAEILAFAEINAKAAGLANVTTQVADGEQLPVADAVFDQAVCRLGLMLFPRPQAAVRELYRVLRPGGGVGALVFGGPERNPCVTTLMSTALRHAGLPPSKPDQPGGLLSLGAAGKLDGIFRDAGFRNVATTVFDAPFRLPSARHYLEFVRSSASPIQQILGRLQPQAAEAAWQDIENQLEKFSTPDGWVGPNELLLTVARR